MVATPECAKADADAFIRIAKTVEEAPSTQVATCWRQLKFWAALILLVPLRLVLITITLALIWVLYRISICLGCCNARPLGDGTFSPHSRAQRAVLWLNWVPYRLLLLWTGLVWIRIHYPDEESRRRHGAPNATIVANHVSCLDGSLLGCMLRCQLTGVAIRWVTKLPLLSTIAKAHHVLAVGRTPEPKGENDVACARKVADVHTKSATDVIAEYQRLCAEDLNLVPLLVFPEGTTKAAQSLVKFRSGAFVSGEPVRPVALRLPPRMSWVRGLGSHLLLMLTQWFYMADFIWLPLYTPSPDERASPRLYADNVQAAIAGALGLPPERVSSAVGAKEMNEASADK